MTVHDRCPCCGAAVRFDADFIWHPQQRILTGRGHAICFGPTRAKIFDAVWRARLREAITREQIAQIVYGADADGGPEFALNIVTTLIGRLRNELRPFGLQITSGNGPGAHYRLVDVSPAATQRRAS